MADKDVGAMMDEIADIAASFIAVEPPNPRAMKAGRLAELLSACGKPAVPRASIPEGVLEAVGRPGKTVSSARSGR